MSSSRVSFADPRADLRTGSMIFTTVQTNGVEFASTAGNLAIDSLVAATSGVSIGVNRETPITLGPTTAINHSTTGVVPWVPLGAHDTNNTNASAISLTTAFTLITTGGAETRTIAAPGAAGLTKRVVFLTDGGDCVITITGMAAANDVVTMNEAGQAFTIMGISPTTWIFTSIDLGDTTVQSGVTLA